MGKLFGTDGVRGIANSELDCDLAFKLGQAGAYVLTSEKHKPKILVGRDTRLSGDMLESALIAGICSVGAEAVIVGILPTPAIAYLTRHYHADAGVVISASHNSVEYNGIKFFNDKGYKLPDALENRIESIIFEKSETIPVPTGVEIGRMVRIKNAAKDYADYVKSTIDGDLTGVKVVLDCANGAAFETAPAVFEALGATVYTLYNKPDGTNINDLCGSTHPDILQNYVLEVGADVGLAFDGDADRLIAVDEHGQLVDGDQIMVVCGLDMRERGKLNHNTIVATIMSNLGFDIALKKADCKFVKTTVGDRYVLEKMIEEGFNIGGEQSGHIIFLDYNTTGDGTITGLQLLSAMKRKGKTLSELAGVMQILPQVLVNARVRNEKKNDYLLDDRIVQEIQAIEKKFADNGRVLIRPSGTEPLVRVMIEGHNVLEIEKDACRLAKMLEEILV